MIKMAEQEQKEQKPRQENKAREQKPEFKPVVSQNKAFRHIVRIANTDLDGSKPIYHALTKIKGVGFMFANMVCNLAKVDKYKKAGDLNEKEVSILDSFIADPVSSGAPAWMLNRRKDYDTGVDKHIVTGELKFANENDIRLLKKIRCYRGVRHIFGLPVRGQRTKSNFRKNKGKVQGVVKKAVAPAAATEEKGGGKDKGKGK
jgi:small subunit ribosomal protein S13